MKNRYAIEMRAVSFQYAESAHGVSDLNLRVSAGECIVLTGPSGCGKTTVTRLINALAPHYYRGSKGGQLFLLGKEISALPSYEIGRLVGSIFQDPSRQFFSSELEGEVAFACENVGMSHAEIRRRTDDAIGKMRIESVAGTPLDALSSGEKQRTAVAAAYALSPRIFVFDEPTANLDEAGVETMRGVLSDLKAAGHTLVIAEHRLGWLSSLADRYLYMKDGRIVQEYAPSELRNLSARERLALGIRRVDEPGAAHKVEGDHADEAVSRILDGKRRFARGAWEWRESVRKELPPQEPERHPDRDEFALCAESLSCKRGGKTIWEGVDVRIRAGALAVLKGKNGSGKTTLAMVLSGLWKPHKGRIGLFGEKVRAARLRKHVYYCSNDTGTQFFTNRVAEELLLNLDRDEAAIARARDLLKRMELYEYRDAHPESLSGGQKQRLAVCCALMSGRDILILDEPTSGLDAGTMRLISDELKRASKNGKTLLIVTHDEEFISSLFDTGCNSTDAFEA